MKAVLPILICSAISGGLGYYFGHITLPADPGSRASQSVASVTAPPPQPAAYTAPAPEFPASAPASPADTPPPAPSTAAPSAAAPVADALTSAAAAPTAPTAPVVAAEPVSAPATAGANNFAARAAQTIQTLTDKQGRSIQATIVEVLESEVKIRRSDGLMTTIPLNMLSDNDVAFCNYLREEAKKKEVIKPDNSGGFDWDAYFNS